MAQRNNNYAEDGTIRRDAGVVSENTPSHEGVSWGEAASNEELQHDKVDMDAMYDFLYGNDYSSEDTNMAEGADENEVITDPPGDSAWTQALDIVSNDLGLDAPSPQVLQGNRILGLAEVEDHNFMMQLHQEESLMQSGKVPWYTPEYRALFEEGVRLRKIAPLGDHLLPLQSPTLSEERVGSEVSMVMPAMNPGGGGDMADMPIEARLRYALLADQEQKLKRLRVALQLHTEKLMVMTTWEEVARLQCSFQVQHLRALGSATKEGMAFKQQLRVTEDAHTTMVEAVWGRHGEWLIQQQLKWNVDETETAFLLLQNQMNDVAVGN